MTRYFATAAAATLLLAGCNTYNDGESISLDSTAPGVEWQIRPYDDLKEFSGEEISMPGFDMGEYVRGVVPGTVFTAYVEAGIEEDPDYGDNIYRVDETFYNRPFWYRMHPAPRMSADICCAPVSMSLTLCPVTGRTRWLS